MSRSGPAKPSVHGQGKQLLLRAAGELFAEKGFAGTATRDIAERAGITEPMLFRHFGSKANLFQQAAVAPFVEFMAGYIEEYRTREHGRLSAEQEGRRFFDGLFHALREQRELLIALMSAHQFDQISGDISGQIRGAFAQVLELFEEVVATESKERGFTDFDLTASVRVMLSMVLSVALHGDWLLIDDQAGYQRILDTMTTMAVHGLQVPTVTGPEQPH